MRRALVKRTYISLVHKGRDGDYGVSFPDLPGCITAGAALEGARGDSGGCAIAPGGARANGCLSEPPHGVAAWRATSVLPQRIEQIRHFDAEHIQDNLQRGQKQQRRSRERIESGGAGYDAAEAPLGALQPPAHAASS